MKSKFVSLPLATLFVLPASGAFAQEVPSTPPPPSVVAPVVSAPAVAQESTKKPAATPKPKEAAQTTKTKPGAKGSSKGQVTIPAPGTPGPGATPAKPAWLEFKLNPKTTLFLDFTEANPDMIISIFARASGITILKDPQFKTPLTIASAKAVNLADAFELFNAVLNLYGYEVQKSGKYLMVAKKQPPQPPPSSPPPPQPQPLVKTYTLKNATASQVAKVILDVFGPAQNPGMPGFGGPPQGGDGKPPIKVTSEDYSNSVVVFALPAQHDDIASLLKDLDKNATTTLESKLFQLKYVPADQVLSAIEDVLTANSPTGRAARKSGNDNQNQGYYFNYYGGSSQNRQKTAGGQSATAIKQTNSVIVNATPENLVLVRELLDKMDQPAAFLGTTFVLRLQNAKATDLADLLNKSLTQKSNNNDDFIRFFYFGDNPDSNKKNDSSVDFNEKGEIVNVRDLIGNVNVTADPNTNSLIVVTQPSNMKMINEIVSKLDQVADQVVIETIIVEANLDKTTKLGVEWSFNNTSLFGDKGTTGTGKTDFGLQPAAGVGQGAAYTITGQHYKAFVNALQTDTRFKVLDTPRIFTSNNVKAEINVSQRQPYITSQETNTGGNLVSNYQFVDIGVVLRVTPRITSSGQVVMDVSQSADDLQGYTSFNAPIINHREATTTVSVKDGSTVVLGGIIRNTLSSTDKKVPLLGDIPLFGHLFRSSTKTTGQTELLVFLTPHIIRTNSDAQKLREDVTKELTKSSQDSLKKQIPTETGKGSGQ